MSKCVYDKNGHCILNECLYGDLLKEGEKPMCYEDGESTVERIARDIAGKATVKGAEMNDTILCHDKENAKNVIDALGGAKVKDWEFLESGKVKLILNGRLEDIKEQK